MKVAIAHDWLTGMRGGEKVLEAMLELFPQADLYTLFHLKGSVSPKIEKQKIQTSFLQKFPLIQSHYRYYLPLFPRAIERLQIKNYDLLITSSHCVAKGITKEKNIPNISYCHTPMRYLWLMTDEYFQIKKNPVAKIIFSKMANSLKSWDLASNKNIDLFIANSETVRDRISRFYGRSSDVIYPPVDTNQFSISQKIEDYYLVVSAWVPYKKIDLAIRAFIQLGYPLIIVGRGPEEATLKKLTGERKNIRFLDWQTPKNLSQLFCHCKAFIFPGEEDFGITPVEAMASGRPVIAFARGGALETVTPETGIFFNEQTPEALIEAVLKFESERDRFHSEEIRKHALKFDKSVFKRKLKEYIEMRISTW